MTPIDIDRIKREALELRVAEMRRLEGIAAERLALMGRLMAATLLKGVDGLSEVLRPLFSWNPQPARRAVWHPAVAWTTQLNRFARSLFAWNPQPPRHC